MCESISNIVSFNDENHGINGFKRLQELLYREEFCDTEIIGKDERHLAHAAVLASFSDYFNDVSNHTKKSDGKIEINLDKTDDDMLKKVIEYCYTGKIDINKDNVTNLLNTAGLLQIPYLINASKEVLKTVISFENCFSILELATLYLLTDLQNLTMDFIKFNFSEAISTEEFLNIEYRQFIELLKSEDLNVTLEMNIFKCVKRWISHNIENRKQHLHSLLEHVKLSLLPSEILFDEVQPLCTLANCCTDLLLEAVQYQTVANRRPELESSRTTPRIPGSVVLVIGDWYENVASIVLMYDPLTTNWSELVNIDTKLKNFNAVILENDIIILGGFIGNEYKSTVECYNLESDKKTILPNMLEPRNHPCVGVINGFIYVTGGYNGSDVIKTAEKYDPKSKTWKYIAAMPTARDEGVGVVLKNEFFVIGGNNIISSLNNVEAFCPKTEKWRICEPMNIPRAYAAGTVINECIYIVGGSKLEPRRVLLRSAERYDPKSKTWTLFADMSIPKYGLAISSIGNNILAMGGQDGRGATRTVEEYDVVKNQWKQLKMFPARVHLNAITVSRSFIKRIKPNSL